MFTFLIKFILISYNSIGDVMKKEEFKEFVKKNPILISYVKNNEKKKKKFYEMYDLFGEDKSVWKDYLKEEKNNNQTDTNIKTGLAGLTFGEFIKWLKNVDLDGLQEGIGNVQRVLGVVQDFSKKDSNTSKNPTYRPRPLYKHFED